MPIFMLKYKFPYSAKLNPDGTISFFPAITAIFSGKNGNKISTLLVIDSGADITLLSKSDAGSLGIDLEKGKEISVRGIYPKLVSAFLHQVEIKIGNFEFEIPVLFSTSNETPRILGREGIFEKFFILFDEKGRQTIFIFRNLESQKELKTILDGGA